MTPGQSDKPKKTYEWPGLDPLFGDEIPEALLRLLGRQHTAYWEQFLPQEETDQEKTEQESKK